MQNNKIEICIKNINHKDKITETLSKYTEIIINEDKSVLYKDVYTNYFLENNKWYWGFLASIEQFKYIVTYDEYNHNCSFEFNNKNINKEIKFIMYNLIFVINLKPKTIRSIYNQKILAFSKFINEIYPNINSLKELDLKKTRIQFINWIETNKKLSKKTILSYGNFFNYITNLFNELIDDREVWEKDIWYTSELEKYGINYNRADIKRSISFSNINNLELRKNFKKYIKQKLIIGNKFSYSTALNYIKYISLFMNYIYELEPEWNDLKKLERHHIEKYLEWLNIRAKNNITRKTGNSKEYYAKIISTVKIFLTDIQDMEYDIAPVKDIKTLIRPDDKPKVNRYNTSTINYIPDFVLEQLFNNINNLNKEFIPVIYIMYRTGLRISDVLNLKQDCLIKLDNKYWLKSDIRKVYIKNHKIPIDDELANILTVLINNSKIYSNEDNNPNKFIFVRYTGKRKGFPYTRALIQSNLNLLAVKCNIVDESGNIYHFKNHSFRHTYAIKMLNNGVDILTVQELLAHVSPEMTMCYAKLLDDTKRRVFDEVVKQGIFSFDEGNKLKEENDGEIPSNIIDMLYTDHKLNAIDTPYGTCMQRKNGKCSYAKQPPCLTCNNGNPCKDLCIGAFEGDITKYNILINSTKSMIENAKIYNRIEMISENTELLNLYEDIYSKISQGNMIYSRLDKLRKKEVTDD